MFFWPRFGIFYKATFLANRMAEYGGKDANGKDRNSDGPLPIQLCLQHCCYTVCKIFLESSLRDCGLEAASRCISTISEIVDQLPLCQTTTPKFQLVTSRNECNYEALGKTDLQLLLVLTTFCVKIWNRELEVVDDPGRLKSLSDYVEYFFDILSYSDGGISDAESGSEGSRSKKKTYIIRHLNSQRILLKNEGSVNRKEVINMFNELNEKKLILYPKEVRKVILNPQLEVPNFLDYSTFFLAVKQLVIDILEKCGSSYLASLQNILAKSKVVKNTSSSGGGRLLLHEIFDGFGDINYKEMQESSPECLRRKVSSSTKEELPSQDEHHEIGPIASELESSSLAEDDEIEPTANEVVYIDVTVDEEQKKNSYQKRRKFTKEEENWLRKGVKKYGAGKWKVILESYPFHNRTSVNLKDKFRNMMKNNQL